MYGTHQIKIKPPYFFSNKKVEQHAKQKKPSFHLPPQLCISIPHSKLIERLFNFYNYYHFFYFSTPFNS